MQEQELRHLIEEVRQGALPRRNFIQQMVGLGLTAPMASIVVITLFAEHWVLPHLRTLRSALVES